MQVLHVIPSLNVGGTETMLLKLLRFWATDPSSEVSSEVVCIDGGGPLHSNISELGIPVHILSDIHAPALLSLIKIIKIMRPDVIQTWLYRGDFYGSLAAAFTGHRCVIWNLRCSHGWGDRGLMRRILFQILRRMSIHAEAIVSNTNRAVEEHIQVGYRSKRWELIANGFDTDVFRPNREAAAQFRSQIGIGDDERIIGMVARFDPVKDHITFLRAAKRLASSCKDIHFVLVGDGLRENLSDDINALGLQNVVHIVGYRSDVENVLPSFDVATLSSIAEGFPNAIGEAMACGLPCVMTHVGDVADLIDERWIVNSGDASALASAWKAMLDLAPSQRAKIGQRNRSHIVDQYSIARVAEAYADLYRRCVKI